MPQLAEWQNFYVIVGSSAGALIGLQFVVITLIANIPAKEGQAQAGDAFATPTVLHFCAVLLFAGIQTTPWNGPGPLTIVWGLLGTAGVAYELIVARRMRAQKIYKPVFEDWLCHVHLPLVGYATIAAAAFLLRRSAAASLLAVGAAVLVLLFSGIHNAWDAVTYHVFYKRQGKTE